MSNQHKPLTAAEIEEIKALVGNHYTTWESDDKEAAATYLARLLSMLTPPTDEELREAVERMECVLLSRLLDGADNVEVMYADLRTLLRAAQAATGARGEADAMLSAMIGECSMCGNGPGCGKDCDGYDHWIPKHDASPESLELLKALRLADKGKLASALRAAQAPRLTPEQVEAPRKAGPCDKRQPEPEDCPECDGAGQQINVLAGPTSGLMRNCPACHGTGIKGFVPEPKDTELREAVERMECVLLSCLFDGTANAEVMYADLRTLLAYVRAAQAPRTVKPKPCPIDGHLRDCAKCCHHPCPHRPARPPRLTVEHVEAAFREGYELGNDDGGHIDVFCHIKTHSPLNDPDFAWEHSEARAALPGVFGKEG